MSGYYKNFAFETSVVKLEKTSVRRDLLAELPVYGVISDAPIREMHKTDYFNTKEENFTLTNGKIHEKLDYLDPAFTHFSGGTGRTLLYKLPCICAVDEFEATFFYQRSVGIYYPRQISVFLSEDGLSWERVYFCGSISVGEETETRTFKAKFAKVYKALFVRLEFDFSLHIWMEKLSLYGTTAIPQNAVSPIDDGTSAEKASKYVGEYPDYGALGGVHNIVLAYNCFPPEYDDTRKITTFNKDNIRPYLAYLDREGNIKDTFFDGVLFLPFSKFTYSAYYKSAEGWKLYLDNTFAEGENVDAVNDVAGEIRETLGVNFKPKVFLSVLHTNVSYGEHPEKFGALDESGDIDIKSSDGRKKAVRWLIDEYIRRFYEKERPNVELGGFYWFEEQINFNDPLELELLAFVREYLAQKGQKLFWIPYYQAWGYTEWKSLGFDIACMQPNYAFQKDAPKQRLYDNAELCKKYGLCFELELASCINDADINKYKDYLDCGVETGYMHSVKMYYEGGRGFKTACEAENGFSRSVYDDTYLFAKEKLIKAVRK